MYRLADFHPAYVDATPEEVRLMVVCGATIVQTTRDTLRAAWSAEMSAEEVVKAAQWRAEGRTAALDELRTQLDEAKVLALQLADAKASNAALRASVEAEAARRAEELMELVKLKEVAPLKEALAKGEGRAGVFGLLEEAHESMKYRIAELEAELAESKAAATKSSHAIGKAGEATVWEMIESVVLPEFMYSEAKNMSGVSHAADFHLSVMMPSGRHIKILIDSKKYKRPVSTDEINKLVADVDGDDEAHAGMMVSLVSPICKTKQFQIKATDKGKPILYLSFQDIPQEQHAKILCWGVHAVMSAVNETQEAVSVDIERTEELLNEICGSLKEVDGMVKTHQKMIETLRAMKVGILSKISSFRGEDVIVHEAGDGCISVLKATGVPCGKPVVEGELKCRHHMKR